MSASGLDQLLADLTEGGMRVQVKGDKLAVTPKSAITPALRERLKAHKIDLLARIRLPDPLARMKAETHADRETRRFLAVAVPHPDGSGCFDPAEREVVEAIRELRDKPEPTTEPRLPGPPGELYPAPGGGTETFHERAVRLREEWKVKGYPPNICPKANGVIE